MPRIAIVLFFTIMLSLAATTADAAPALDNDLGTLWTKVLQTPAPHNPVVGGDGSPCWDLGGTIAPLANPPVGSCTVKPGTKIFVAASSAECSTFPNDCVSGAPPAAQLPELALQADLQLAGSPPAVKLDGKNVAVTEVTTGLLKIVLPADNVFGQPSGATGQSVAHGWVALLHPLTPGTHTIAVTSSKLDYQTSIIVRPGL